METTTSKTAPTATKGSTKLDDALVQVERLYRAVVGDDPPADAPHVEIPPERDLGVFLNTQVERLLEALGAAAEPKQQPQWTPATTISEEASTFVVELDVAGVRREDIKIIATAAMMEITGVRSSREGLQIRMSERPVGIFRRVLALPPNCDFTSVSARLSDGVLSIRVPRAHTEETAPRLVAIA